MIDIASQVAFISGGASGIGLGIARALVAAGAKVAIANVVQGRCTNLLQHFRGSADPDLPRVPHWRELA